MYPLMRDYPDVLDRQKELVAQVSRARPAFIVMVRLATSLDEKWLEGTYLWERVWEMIFADYVLDGAVDMQRDGAVYVFGERDANAFYNSKPNDAKPPILIFRRKK